MSLTELPAAGHPPPHSVRCVVSAEVGVKERLGREEGGLSVQYGMCSLGRITYSSVHNSYPTECSRVSEVGIKRILLLKEVISS